MWPKVDREGVCSSLHDYDVTLARRHTLAELVGLLFSVGIQLAVDPESRRLHATTF